MQLPDRARSLLNWAERKLQVDLRYLIKGGSAISLSQVAGTAAGAATSLLFAHLASQETVGTYQYILSLASTLSNLCLVSGVTLLVLQSSSHDGRGMLRTGFLFNIATSGAVFLVTIVTGLYYLYAGNVTLAVGLFIASGLDPLIASFSLYGTYLNAKRDFLTTSYLFTMRSAITVCALTTALFLGAGPLALVATYSLSAVSGCAIAYYVTARRYPQGVERVTHRYRDMIGLSSKVSLIGAVKGITQNLDVVIVFHFLGPSMVAIYSYAVALPEMILNLLGNVGYALAVPKFVVNYMESDEETLGTRPRPLRMIPRRALQTLLVTVPIVALYLVFSPYIYELLLPRYVPSIPYSQFFIFVIIIASLGSVFGALQDAQKNIRDKAWAAFPPAAIRIVLMLLLVRPFGLWGIMFSEFVARSINALISYALLRKYGR